MSARIRRRSLRRAAAIVHVIKAGVTAQSGFGPGGVTGTGPARTEARTVAPFNRVEVGDGIGLTIRVGGAQTVAVDGQADILPLVTTSVVDGVLKIASARSFSTTTGVSVSATLPALDAVSASGGSAVSLSGIAADRLVVDLDGGAGLVATGTATDVVLGVAGGARADLAALAAETMTVTLSGGATAAVRVSVRVDGTASGGAVATIVGGAELAVRTSGGARVTGE
jgi:hypothetical protein